MRRAMAIGAVCAFFIGALASIATEAPIDPDYVAPIYIKEPARTYSSSTGSGAGASTITFGTSTAGTGSYICSTGTVPPATSAIYVQQ